MTTLQNTTIRNVVAKTSFNYGSLESDLLLTGMSAGLTFIKSYIIAKALTK